MTKENKFNRNGQSLKEKKRDWNEANRCEYESMGLRCYMLGTRLIGERKYCSWHIDVLRISDSDQRNEFETKKNFLNWYSQWKGHFDLFKCQWSDKNPDILWDAVKCEPNYR